MHLYLSITFSYCYAEYHYAECPYAQCRSVQNRAVTFYPTLIFVSKLTAVQYEADVTISCKLSSRLQTPFQLKLFYEDFFN
jgi:hypothetical protein